MKILLTTLDFAQGGVSTALLEVVRLFERNGIEYRILVERTDGPYRKAFKPEFVFCAKRKARRESEAAVAAAKDAGSSTAAGKDKQPRRIRLFLRKVLSLFPKSQRLVRVLRTSFPRGKFDLVIDFHGYANSFTGLLADRYRRTPKLTWVHTAECAFLEWVKEDLPEYDGVACVSEVCRRNALRYVPTLTNTRVVYNFVDKDELKERAKSFEVTHNKFMLLSIGRLSDAKGFDLIPGVAASLKKKGHDFVWYILGEGEDRKLLTEMIREHRVEDRVELLGFQENPYPYLAACDVCVQPSRVEGYCMVILEALAFLKVIVASDIPPILEGLQGINADLALPRNEESFTDTLGRLMSDISFYEEHLQNVRNGAVRDYSGEFLEYIRSFAGISG